MTIAEIIEKHYDDLQKIPRDKERIVSEAKTDEDYFQDVCITALRKYKNKDIEESEGLSYIQKNLRMEMKFKFNRIDKRISYMEDCEGLSNI